MPGVRIERENHFGDFTNSGIERGGNSGEAAAAVQGAEGLQALILTRGDEAGGAFRKGLGVRAEAFEKSRVQRAHIAGDDEIPFGAGMAERGFDAGKRATAGALVGSYREAECAVFEGISDNRCVASGKLDLAWRHVEPEQCRRFARELYLSPSACCSRPPGRNRLRSCGNDNIEVCAKSPIERPPLVLFAVLPGLMCAEEAVSNRTTLVVKTDNRTGRLVRSVVVAPRVVNPEPLNQPDPIVAERSAAAVNSLAEMIDTIAAKHEVEGPLVHSVIKAESNYNPLAISPKGAQGLMQLIPSTARRFGVREQF